MEETYLLKNRLESRIRLRRLTFIEERKAGSTSGIDTSDVVPRRIALECSEKD